MFFNLRNWVFFFNMWWGDGKDRSAFCTFKNSYMSARSYKGRTLGDLWWTVVPHGGSEIRGRLIQSEDYNIIQSDVNHWWALISWSVIAKGSGVVPCSFMSSHSRWELCAAAGRGSLSSDHLFLPCTSTNSLYSYMVNQVNDGSVQLSSSARCCTNACASIRSKEDAGPLGTRQGKDGTVVTASVTTKRTLIPAVGQICATGSARRVVSCFLEILQKLWLSYLWPSGEEGEGNQCYGGTLSSYSCTTGILHSNSLAKELEMPLHLCTAELLKYHLKGRQAFWREQEVLRSKRCLAVVLALLVRACPCCRNSSNATCRNCYACEMCLLVAMIQTEMKTSSG